MENSKKRKKLIPLIVIVVLILAAAIFGKLVFWQSSYTVPEYKFSAELLGKIIKAQDTGGTAQLTKDEVNQVISLYSKEYKSGNITIKAAEADFDGSNMKFYVPAAYKGFNVLVTSEGSISKESGKIKYTPDYFKVGKITLPKSYVLKKLSGRLKDKTAVEQNSIVINTEGFPVGITALDVKNDRLLVTLEKRKINIEDILKGKFDSIKNMVKDYSDLKNSEISTKTNGEAGKTQQNNGTNSSTSGGSTAASTEKQQALDQVISGLNSASGSVSTSGQKAVISQMISVVGSMKDPSYNPYSAESGVRAMYGKLSQNEKLQLKAAVFANVDTSSASILYNMIGK